LNRVGGGGEYAIALILKKKKETRWLCGLSSGLKIMKKEGKEASHADETPEVSGKEGEKKGGNMRICKRKRGTGSWLVKKKKKKGKGTGQTPVSGPQEKEKKKKGKGRPRIRSSEKRGSRPWYRLLRRKGKENRFQARPVRKKRRQGLLIFRGKKGRQPTL